MKEQIKEISAGKIRIFDDVFSFEDRSHFNKFFYDCYYKPMTGADPMLWPSHRYVMTSMLTQLDVHNLGFFDKISDSVINVLRDYNITRSYVISSSYDLEPKFHCDKPSELTLLYYVNTKWDRDWGGETMFANNELTEIEYCSMFVPGRIVIFDSNIPHRPSPSTCVCSEFRYTFVTNFVRKEA